MNSKEAKKRVEDAADEAAHSGKADKAKGHVKEVVGSAKAKLGHLIGNDELEAKGNLQNAEGKKDRLKGEIKEGYEDAKDKLKAGVDLVKDKLHDIGKR